MTFQKELGSMFDKVVRLKKHVLTLGRALLIPEQKKLLRAAELSKADLASLLVGEFPDLQGTVGRNLALAQKEEKEVAEAIAEHWMPRAEDAPLPKTPTGMILSLADKLDNLLGYFNVGLKPTSSSDPYALRRQAIGIIRILVDSKHSVNLKELLEACSQEFPSLRKNLEARDQIIFEILQFVTSRAKSIFESYEFKKDEIEAALKGICIDPFDQFRKVKALNKFRKNPTFGKLFEVYKRAKGQLEKPAAALFNPSLMQEKAERELWAHVEKIHQNWKYIILEKDYEKAFIEVATFQPYIANLFDTVKILADDPKLRENRIALLQKVFAYFDDLLDFSKIQETK
jgi:glycyl-tRNA synthetase